jgi:hypothetical protein
MPDNVDESADALAEAVEAFDKTVTRCVTAIVLVRDTFTDDTDDKMVDVTQALRGAQDKLRAALAAYREGRGE